MQIAWHLITRVCLWTKCAPITSGSACSIRKTLKDFVKSGKKGLSGSVPFENEQRARRKDGKYRWFLIRYNPFIDEKGNVTRWYATGTDAERID